MRLNHELVLEQARMKDLKIILSAEDPKITLGVRAQLTPEVAECFGCKELVYAGDVPRSGVDKMKLDGDEIDTEVRLENDNFAFQATANSIGDYVAKFTGTGPVLEFKIKLTGYAGIVTDVAERVKVDPLKVTLRPAQRDLDLQPDTAPAADDSERLISAEQAADTTEADQDAAPAVASVVSMGGSHQKGNRKKHGRRGGEEIIDAPAIEPEPPADEADFMQELGIPEPVVN